MGWLSDEVIFFSNFFECCGFVYYFFLLNQHVSVPLQHIHEYYRLITEKQMQYHNALVQRVTHTDTFFWVTCRHKL